MAGVEGGRFSPSPGRGGRPLGPALLLAVASAIVGGTAAGSPAPADARSPFPSTRARGAAQIGVATGPLSRLAPARAEAIEVVLTNEMARLGVPGLSLAIAHDGELVFANGYGFADVENFVSAKADTVYRLASLSKPMTAVAVLQLTEKRLLDLDAPVRDLCPAFPKKRWTITPRQLLSHTAGIRHYRDGEQPMTRRYETLEEGLALFKDDPLEFEPGSAYLYSTYGYSLLGCVVEGVTGEAFPEVLEKAVFQPAGMTRTGPDDVRALVANRARGYARDEQGRLVNAALADMSYKVPGGGLSGTAPDVARFGLALVSGRLLEPRSVEMMMTPVTSGGDHSERPERYGLGLSSDLHHTPPEAWHLGGQEGASTALYLRPTEGLALAVLTNVQGVPPALLPLARRIADLVLAATGGEEMTSP